MQHTIAPARPRAGLPHVNRALDAILGEASWLTTDQLAALLHAEGMIGHADTADSGPVGLWVVGNLSRWGVPAVAYTWVSTLAVHDAAGGLIGEVRVPHTHTLYDLEREVNEHSRPEITWQGEGDPR